MASKIKVDQIEGSTASTITLPSGQTLDLSSGSITLPDSAVDLSTAKVTGTLGSSNLPTVPVSKGGTGVTSLGTANQVLGVNAGATALEFQNVSSDYVKLGSGTVSSSVSTVSIDGYFTSDYDNYTVILNDLKTNGTASNALYLRYNQSGASQGASDYHYSFNYHGHGMGGSTANGYVSNTNQDSIRMSSDLSSNDDNIATVKIDIPNPLSSTGFKNIQWEASVIVGNGIAIYKNSGVGHYRNNTNAISGLYLIIEGSHVFTGLNWKIYGIKN